MSYVNLLLNDLDASILKHIGPQLELVRLEIRQSLVKAGEVSEWIYFPEDGLISLVSEYEPGRHIEVGMIGREGFFDPGFALRDERAAFDGNVQVEGSAYRFSNRHLSESHLEVFRTIPVRLRVFAWRILDFLWILECHHHRCRCRCRCRYPIFLGTSAISFKTSKAAGPLPTPRPPVVCRPPIRQRDWVLPMQKAGLSGDARG
ncbi:hypothetical protein [Devosia sp. Root685]|uniref:hypothetical protein n=1 Tax=Devosia sp. Root685 TaxID=1736587 RepID=UPI000AEA8A9D|nr:hypothetical protein [Devosia sp. Root685]